MVFPQLMRLLCWKMASYGNWIPPRRIHVTFFVRVILKYCSGKMWSFAALGAMPRISFVHFLIWENLSSSFDQLSSVWSCCSPNNLRVERGQKGERDTHPSCSSGEKIILPTPDKNSWNRQLNSWELMISQKIPTGQFLAKRDHEFFK